MKKILFLLIIGFLVASYTNVFGMEHEKDDMSNMMRNQQQMMENQQEMMKMMKEMHKDMKEMHKNMEHMKSNHMDMMNQMNGKAQEKQTEHKHGK